MSIYRNTCFSLFVACLTSSGYLLAQRSAGTANTPPLTLNQVVQTMVQRNMERARELQGYQSQRTYTLVYKGFPGNLHAAMVVDVTYQAPDTKTFRIVSQNGPKLLVDQVLKRLVKTEATAQQQGNRERVDLNSQNYNFSNLEYQPATDDCSYIVAVEPKKPSKYLYKGKLWINDKDFAVCRIEAEPSKNPSFWITGTHIAHTYEKVGEFWLPQKNKTVSTIRIGGQATLRIQYQDYKILSAQTAVSKSAAPMSAK